MHRRRAEAEVNGVRREALLIERRTAGEDVDVVDSAVHVRLRPIRHVAVHELEQALPVVCCLVLVIDNDRCTRLGSPHRLHN